MAAMPPSRPCFVPGAHVQPSRIELPIDLGGQDFRIRQSFGLGQFEEFFVGQAFPEEVGEPRGQCVIVERTGIGVVEEELR